MRGELLHHTYTNGKNSKISIVSRQAFDRQTPDGNEFVIEIQYLKRAFNTNTYLIDKVTGSHSKDDSVSVDLFNLLVLYQMYQIIQEE